MSKYIMKWITTEDNPHDPFDNFQEWLDWDNRERHGTLAYIFRVAETVGKLDISMPPGITNQIINEACDDIAKMNLTGKYKLVTRETDAL